jgi:hypothetical protein
MNTHLKKCLTAVAVLVGVLGSRAWALNTPADATITVTPVVDVSLAISPTTYAFGLLDVNTSSVSATALALSNNGDVNVTVDKRIQTDPANWIADTSSTTANHYVLFVTTAVARPAQTDFTTGAHRFGAVSNVTNLNGVGGSQPVITTSGGALPSVNLWFRLDMPTQVTTSAAQTTSRSPIQNAATSRARSSSPSPALSTKPARSAASATTCPPSGSCKTSATSRVAGPQGSPSPRGSVTGWGTPSPAPPGACNAPLRCRESPAHGFC